MSDQLNPDETEKLLELQEQCDACKEAIIHEGDLAIRTEMEKVCEKCKKVRVRVPDLMELKHKLQAFNAEHKG